MADDPFAQEKEEWWYRGALMAASILAICAGVVAAVLGGLAWTQLGYYNSPGLVYGSGILPVNPFVFYIAAAGTPVAMTLPNDLTPYIGNIYRVWSKTAQAHTLTISGLGSTFDGVATQATFGGAIGDGLIFEVIAANRIVVISSVNVVFI
jgi:hypothetical protein